MAVRMCIQCGDHFEGSEGYGPYCSEMCRNEAKDTAGKGPNGHHRPSNDDEEDE